MHILAQASGIPVSWCSGSQLATTLVATINDILFFCQAQLQLQLQLQLSWKLILISPATHHHPSHPQPTVNVYFDNLTYNNLTKLN